MKNTFEMPEIEIVKFDSETDKTNFPSNWGNGENDLGWVE